MKDNCPKCGSHLILRDGQYGEFLACPRFPDCRYTKSCRDVDELYQPPSPYCKRCNYTGLLPFVKNGKIIPNAFIDCECKLNTKIEHYQTIFPEDYDFACSTLFREHLSKYSDP